MRAIRQFGLERIAELPDAPTAIELARDETGRHALRVHSVKYKTTYPFILPPGVPADRIGVDVNPLGGAQIKALMREIDAAPQAAIDSLKNNLN